MHLLRLALFMTCVYQGLLSTTRIYWGCSLHTTHLSVFPLHDMHLWGLTLFMLCIYQGFLSMIPIYWGLLSSCHAFIRVSSPQTAFIGVYSPHAMHLSGFPHHDTHSSGFSLHNEHLLGFTLLMPCIYQCFPSMIRIYWGLLYPCHAFIRVSSP